MRPFWQSIAFILLAVFLPATMHCPLGAGQTAPAWRLQSCAAQTVCDSSAASADTCHAEAGEERRVPDSPRAPLEHHACPSSTLAQTQIPPGVHAPGLQAAPDSDGSMLPPWAFHPGSIAFVLLTHAFDSPPAFAPGSPALSENTGSRWMFSLRTALPARWPSDLYLA
ncbi:hypothetical protein DB346_18720 [Verrucomicrobia bacterium LW23]|nr:hypothetical protein DB346_18720 [Verrucomicrobia bacterium LW23]